MDKPKKEVIIDFDLYVKEKKDTFIHGSSDGFRYALKNVTSYLKQDIHIKEVLKGDFVPEWEPLMQVLGRDKEWKEFLKERQKSLKEENND